MKRFALFISVCILMFGMRLAGEERSWTLADGRTFKGEYLSAEGNKVRILMKGRERTVAIALFSDEDKEFITDRKNKEQAPGSVHENNNFNNRWPSSSSMEDKQKAKVIQEEEGNYIYETTHFRFFSPAKLALSTVKEIGRIFEGTYTANLLLPLNPPCRRYEGNITDKLPARLFLTREEYAQAIGPNFAESAGLFNGKEVLVPFPSLGIVKKGDTYAREAGTRIDSHTLVHEITHQMTIFGAKYLLPIWYAEGIAEYVGVTPYNNGNLKFTGTKKALASYAANGRQLGTKFTSPPLKQFMEQPMAEFQSASGKEMQFNYGMSMILFYYFAHIDGRGDAARLKRWMRALQNGECGTTEYDRLLDGRTWKQLEKDVSKGVKSKLGITITFRAS